MRPVHFLYVCSHTRNALGEVAQNPHGTTSDNSHEQVDLAAALSMYPPLGAWISPLRRLLRTICNGRGSSGKQFHGGIDPMMKAKVSSLSSLLGTMKYSTLYDPNPQDLYQ